MEDSSMMRVIITLVAICRCARPLAKITNCLRESVNGYLVNFDAVII